MMTEIPSMDGQEQGKLGSENTALASRGSLRKQMRLLGGLISVCLVSMLFSLFWFGHSQDRIALKDSLHLVETAVRMQMRSMQRLTTDYVLWDEAYQNLALDLDTAWYDSNFGDAEHLRDTFGITGSLVIGPDNKMMRHMRDSNLIPSAPMMDTSVYFRGGLDLLIESARRMVDGKYVAVTGFVKLAGKYYFASAGVIQAHTTEMRVKVSDTASNGFVAAFLRPLDERLLRTTGGDFGLLHLRYVEADDPAGLFPLRTTDGDLFGALVWQVDRPGQEMLRVMLPVLLVVAFCIGLLFWRGLDSMRRGQAKLIQAMQQAELADRSKTEFLANMSHELRTPLNAILGFSQLMREEAIGPIGNETYKDYSRDIHHSGQCLLNIINDVLELSRVDTGKFALTESEIALDTTVASLRNLIGPRTDQKGIALEINVSPDLPAIVADSAALKQILINLLSNAVKFTESGGRIIVAARRISTGEVEIKISDTGCGMPRDQLDLVMRPFHRATDLLTSAEGGAGLGLPLCASLVGLHGGSIRITSAVDQGTTVYVTWPKERVAETAQAA